MSAPASELARKIDRTGWSTVVLGAACIALAGLEAAMPLLLRRLAALLEGADDPTRAMRDALSAGAGMSAAVNGLFGVALVVIGIGVLRRARWAHPALALSGWASIGVLAILARPSLAPFFALARDDVAAGYGMLLAAGGLVVVQIGAVLWFLRFWKRQEVRAAFR
jgi:hypothetical protein